MRSAQTNSPGEMPEASGLRPLTGADELSVTGTGSQAALDLLGRLFYDLDVDALTVEQSDRALAAIYQMLYGPLAECRMGCEACGETYEFTLDLPQIIAGQDDSRPGPPNADGTWTLPGGAKVRAPKHADLTGDPNTLASRLTSKGKADLDTVESFLETAAPVLTLDLEAPCPACHATAQVRFDLATYLTRRLVAERPFLIRETHLIASRYGWSHSEIMGLSRDDRRTYAGLIEAERARLSRRQTA